MIPKELLRAIRNELPMQVTILQLGRQAPVSNSRADKGSTRKVTPEEVLEAINTALPHFHRKKKPNKSAIYRFCIERGILRADQIALTTFCRFVREYELLKEDVGENKRRLAFSMQHANQLWQADTMFGPQVERRQVKLIALIDDASRVLCHGEFFFEENADAMVRAIRAAFYKRGVPEQLLVDNGSIYCCREITLICARVGCILRHTAVRDAAAKGKIERFFRRVRDQFLVRNLDLSSLEELNKQFTRWVEYDYNATEHSTLGMKPIDRFGMDLSRIRFLSPSEDTDELFYAEAVRTVKKDNTFSFRSVRYETPVDLRGKKVEIRYERNRKGAVVVYIKGKRMGMGRPLDAVANGLVPCPPPSLPPSSQCFATQPKGVGIKVPEVPTKMLLLSLTNCLASSLSESQVSRMTAANRYFDISYLILSLEYHCTESRH